MNFDECMKFIHSYSRLGGKVTDLSRASELMDRIGNPQKKLKFVHIAGTNGKGSTLEYISKALELSGYKTGKLTSPFITHYTDRIRINSEEINEKSLGKICGYVAEKAADREYSQFEITMAIAFLWFAEEECDIVVLETGIGGLLDSTNVIDNTEVAVITSISLDHTAVLGNTIELIAKQKVGIIKEHSYAVLSLDNPEIVHRIFISESKKKNTIPIFADLEYLDLKKIDICGNIFEYKKILYHTIMGGMHQIYNAVTAIEVCGILKIKGYNITANALQTSLKTSQVDARLQYIKGEPDVIVDGGHNVGGMTALSEELKKFPRNKVYVVLGMISNKDFTNSARIIAESSGHIFCIDDFADNSVNADKLAAITSAYCTTEKCSLVEGIRKAKKNALENSGIAVICGSLYLAGEYLNMQKVL